MLSLLTSALLVLLVALAIYLRYRQMSILRRNGIAGPRPNLIYGNLFRHFSRPNVIRFNEDFARYGPIYGYYIGKQPVVAINDIELIKRIQIKDFHLFSDRNRVMLKYGIHPNPPLFHHIITAQGSRWKEVRSLLNPTFSALKLKLMTPTIDSSIEILLDKVERHAQKDEEFDIYGYFQLLTTDVIAKCALGIETNVQNNQNDPFFLAAKKVFDMMPSKILLLFTCFPELDVVLYPLRRGMEMIRVMLDRSPTVTISNLIRAAIQLRKAKPIKHTDLLQLMLDSRVSADAIENASSSELSIDLNNDVEEVGEAAAAAAAAGKEKTFYSKMKSLTEDETIANAIIFFEAGYETTSTMLGFVAHILVNHPDVQEKVRQEVIELYNEEGKLDYNTVNKLSYMQCVLNETMRFYPPVTNFVTRWALQDYKYKDITIPKNASITMPTYQLHHNEQYWPNHDRFDPERFRDKKNLDSIAFQPFGRGPRNCIGMRFALYESKLMLAKLLHRYRLVPGASTELGSLQIDYKVITETPRNGVFVKAVKLHDD